MKNTQKMLHKRDIRVGMLVTATSANDAQVYTVTDIVGNQVELKWYEGSQLCGSWYDIWSLYRPTVEQIEISIASNGPLVAHQANVSTQLFA